MKKLDITQGERERERERAKNNLLNLDNDSSHDFTL